MIVYNFLGKNCLLERGLQNQQPFIDKLQELNINYHKICFIKQVHGNEVAVIDSHKSWQDLYQNSLPIADALVSNQKNIILAIITADCVPVLLFDEKNQIISATHTGYKGAKNNIVAEVLKKNANSRCQYCQYFCYNWSLHSKSILSSIGRFLYRFFYTKKYKRKLFYDRSF